MNLKVALIFVFLIGAALFRHSKKSFVNWCSFFLLLSISLKSVFYGTLDGGGADTYNYVEKYKDVLYMSFKDVWKSFIERYFYFVGEDDIGYLLLEWLISRFSSSYHVFSTILDLVFFIPFAKLIDKYCQTISEALFAFILYLSLAHTFGMYGARQFYAMGFTILFFLYYSEKQYKKSFAALFIGATIHLSCLLALIPFAISFLKPKAIRITHLITLIMIPIVFLAVNRIILFMGNFIGMEKYATYGLGDVHGGAITYILLSELISIFCFFMAKGDMLEDEKFKYLYSMAPVFTFFSPLIFSNGSMMRITIYSQIYLTVLFPYIVHHRFPNKYNIYISLAIIALLFFTLRGGYIPYEFFWKSDSMDLW
ncbi:MAG: EpsG family protein [Bacteroidales bacterium]|nr:EpsG family protein [Bacteroidales bacterium]